MEKHKSLPTQTTTRKFKPADQKSVAFSAHIRELRSRIFWVAMTFIVGTLVAYAFRELLIDIVLSPIGSEKLIYLNPAGGFSFIFQIIMYAGAILAAPFLVLQLYKFVVPALPKNARKHAWLVFLAAFTLMLSGVLFGYLVAIPASLEFLTTFAEGYVEASLTADSYLGFVLAYVAGLGLLFQLPLLLVIWHWIKPLTPGGLFNSQRFLIVFAFIAAAVITPTPDAVNQLLIAGPIIAIYQLGAIAVLMMIYKQRRIAKKAARRGISTTSLPAGRTLTDMFLELPDEVALAPRKPVTSVAVKVVPIQKVIQKPSSYVKPVVKPQPIKESLYKQQRPVIAAPAKPVSPLTPLAANLVSTNRAYRPTLDTLASRRSHHRPVPQLTAQRTSVDGFSFARNT